MYAPFFGLEQPPFSIAPDPRYLFMSERHREALAHLLYGLEAGGGFVLLTGEIGAGKTTVCRCFLEQVPASCHVAYIFNPRLTVPELLRTICDEFGVAHAPAAPGAETVKDCIDPLNDFLLRAHAQGRSCVLVIDEAQNLAPQVLEQLRLLTNLETNEKKLLQIILIGQPELRDLVAQPQLEQLAQRVIARYHLGPLSRAETAQYVAHRLGVAGLRGPSPFGARVLARVHALSQGVPRRINLLCDRALLGAYSRGEREVRPATLRRAAREVFGSAGSAWHAARWPAWAGGALAGAAVTAALAWALAPQGMQPPGTAQAQAARGVSGTQAAGAPQATEDAAEAAPGAAAAAPDARQPPPSTPALAPFLQAQPDAAAGEAAGWRTLALAWQAPLPAGAGDACAALARQDLRCWRTRRASLAQLRLLDRPALLTLAPAGAGDAAPVVVALRQLDGEQALLVGADGRTPAVPLAALAPLWRGEMATLWKAPAGLPDAADAAASRAGAAWLAQQLDRVQGDAAAAGAGTARTAPPDPAALRARIRRFQLAQGLTPDGQAGPLTLMLLNRALGVTEPRLARGG
ncbi:general secretion pathway protein A [Oryzisolibacter propanilivorax]|uniref:General secretion pathway protein A n=1 Tax=Oryzisolibacter propanilivorax TaxID=1527607 RepID=A0A1G9SAA5_9BURK|nr:ExeA family protein [Oryzisolibacter propanilivorax]SDM32301.1 general secretion pathway protein A [Oryzisolibacter propanilivorax]